MDEKTVRTILQVALELGKALIQTLETHIKNRSEFNADQKDDINKE